MEAEREVYCASFELPSRQAALALASARGIEAYVQDVIESRARVTVEERGWCAFVFLVYLRSPHTRRPCKAPTPWAYFHGEEAGVGALDDLVQQTRVLAGRGDPVAALTVASRTLLSPSCERQEPGSVRHVVEVAVEHVAWPGRVRRWHADIITNERGQSLGPLRDVGLDELVDGGSERILPMCGARPPRAAKPCKSLEAKA